MRDSDGDGCLESWCKYDTGEDHALRYDDAPDAWEEETPPQGCRAVPIASMDIMSFSCSARDTLAEIARLCHDEEESARWRRRADAVRAKIKSYLWDPDRGACFDRDRRHERMPVLTHNTLRCMYWKSISPDMARRFVREHLCDPDEFWTPMPLPSVAANDPLFRNVSTNNWSGQAEALTYQRAIRALENYGEYRLIPQLGRKLMEAVGPECRFVQQYDPFTGQPSLICEPGQPPQDCYGPAMLAVMEYTARMYGVSFSRDKLIWGGCGGIACRYAQQWGDHVWQIENDGAQVTARVDGKPVFTAGAGLRVVTDLSGRILQADAYEPGADPGALHSLL